MLFLFFGVCLSAASARSVLSRYFRAPASSSRRVRIKRLSLANWASLSAERKTKPRERARARSPQRQRESESERAFACELLCVECVCARRAWRLWTWSRQPYSNKTGHSKTYRITRAAAPALRLGGPCSAGKTRSLWGATLHTIHGKLISQSRICN